VTRTVYLYVVLCEKDDTLYCGISADVIRRVQQHQGFLRGGARYTRARRPVRLVFVWPYSSRSAALRAEAKFHKLTKKAKLHYIQAALDSDWEDKFGEKTRQKDKPSRPNNRGSTKG
jgi:putative endonuclease